MRYGLLSFTILAFAVALGESQETKKKDDAGKGSKAEPKEPTEINGKTFDQWRKEIQTSKDPAKREMAMKNICLFGARSYDAIQDIIDDLKKHEISKKKGGLGIDLSVRVNGTMAMSTIFRYKEKPDAKHVKEALAIYRYFLKDSQVIMKLRAVQGLPFLGPASREAMDDLITVAKDPTTWEIRKEAIQVLIMMAPNDKGVPDSRVIPVLRDAAVKDSSYLVRGTAVQGMGMLGDSVLLLDFKKVIDNDSSKEVKLIAVQAMANACKEKALFDLKKLMEHPDKDIRVLAVQAYGAAGKEGALFELRKKIDSGEKEIRLQALNTLTNIKHSPTEIPITVKKLNTHLAFEKDPLVKIWTHATIMTVQGKVDKHMDVVVQFLGHKEVPVRLAALQVIALGAADSKPHALKAVTDALDDPEITVAVTATETLVHMRAYETISRLESIMKDAKARVELKEAAENAIDNMELVKAREKKDKKTPDKK